MRCLTVKLLVGFASHVFGQLRSVTYTFDVGPASNLTVSDCRNLAQLPLVPQAASSSVAWESTEPCFLPSRTRICWRPNVLTWMHIHQRVGSTLILTTYTLARTRLRYSLRQGQRSGRGLRGIGIGEPQYTMLALRNGSSGSLTLTRVRRLSAWAGENELFDGMFKIGG